MLKYYLHADIWQYKEIGFILYYISVFEMETSISVARFVIAAIRTTAVYTAILISVAPVCISAVVTVSFKTSFWNFNF